VKPSSKGAPATVTRSEFAALKGWAPSYVTKLIAQQRVVLTPDGKKLDVEASNRRLEETTRLDRQGVREHHARKRGATGSSLPVAPTPSPAPDSASGEGPVGASAVPPPVKSTADFDEYNRARAQKEAAQAAMADLELKRRTGELVEIGQVKDMAARIAGIIARGFERISPRIGPVWSTEQEPVKREQLLEDELRKIQGEFADEVVKILEVAHG
jgi:hypothetical protein